MSNATVAQGRNDLLADGAGAENERGAVGQLAEDAFGELDASGGNGHGARAQFGFRADALSGFERALKEAIKHRAGGALFVGEAVSFADLAEDFGFAEELRIEPGGNAKEMTNSGAIVVLVEHAVEHVLADGVKFAEERRKSRRAFVGGFRGNAIDFAAVAGGEDQGFLEKAAGTEFVGGAARLFESERDALANFERRGAVIQADEDDFHGRLRRTTKNSGGCATDRG